MLIKYLFNYEELCNRNFNLYAFSTKNFRKEKLSNIKFNFRNAVLSN